MRTSSRGDSEGARFHDGRDEEWPKTGFAGRDGIIVAFGQDYPENDTLKWEKERVGLAVAVPQEQAVSQIDDKTSYLFQLVPDARGHIDYVFDTRWRKSEWLEGRSDAECAEGLRSRSVRRARRPWFRGFGSFEEKYIVCVKKSRSDRLRQFTFVYLKFRKF